MDVGTVPASPSETSEGPRRRVAGPFVLPSAEVVAGVPCVYRSGRVNSSDSADQ
jgi:hypothetical protein